MPSAFQNSVVRVAGVKWRVVYPRRAREVSGDIYALSCEYLFAYRARDAEGSGQPARKLPAAASVVRAAVFDERRVVRMGRAGTFFMFS